MPFEKLALLWFFLRSSEPDGRCGWLDFPYLHRNVNHVFEDRWIRCRFVDRIQSMSAADKKRASARASCAASSDPSL
jgi:hypothetical protein